MSTLVLSLLFGFILLCGVYAMRETFDVEVDVNTDVNADANVDEDLAYPTDLLDDPYLQIHRRGRFNSKTNKTNFVSLNREMDTLTESFSSRADKDHADRCPKCQTCPKCPTCPDMSKYIRLDEVPCWNCSLP